MELVRNNPKISGNCFWSADMLVRSHALKDSLRNNYHRYKALVPVVKSFDSIPPAPVTDLRFAMMGKEPKLVWNVKKTNKELDKPTQFIVYAFERNDKIDINNPRYILDIVNKPEYVLPKTPNALCLYYVVTALDRVKNESLPSAPAMYK